MKAPVFSIRSDYPQVSCLGAIYSKSVPSEVQVAIDSLLFGTIAPSQIVLVIDGPISSDLQQLVYRYRSPAFNCIYLKRNVGLGAALREGLLSCHHEYVCRFDTDDVSSPDRLEKCLSFLVSNPHFDIVTSSVYEFRPGNSPLVRARIKHVLLTPASISKNLSRRNTLNHPSTFFRKSVIIEAGSYEHMPYFEDYYLWLKCRKRGCVFGSIDKPLVCMRREATLDRRLGLNYALKEFYFFIVSIRSNLLPWHSALYFLIRVLSRLLPKPLHCLQNHVPWRSAEVFIPNPDIGCRDLSFTHQQQT